MPRKPPSSIGSKKTPANALASHALTSGQLCAQTGVTRGTLRLYEREGLITAKRNPSGYRMFAVECVARLNEIRAAKAIGMTLAEIREILQLIDASEFSRPKVAALLNAKIAQLDGRIRQMQILRQVLDTAANNPELLADPNCNLLADFAQGARVPAPVKRKARST